MNNRGEPSGPHEVERPEHLVNLESPDVIFVVEAERLPARWDVLASAPEYFRYFRISELMNPNWFLRAEFPI